MTRILGHRAHQEHLENLVYRDQRGILLWDPQDLKDHQDHQGLVMMGALVNQVHLDLQDLQESPRYQEPIGPIPRSVYLDLLVLLAHLEVLVFPLG